MDNIKNLDDVESFDMSYVDGDVRFYNGNSLKKILKEEIERLYLEQQSLMPKKMEYDEYSFKDRVIEEKIRWIETFFMLEE